jgi:hypothetical protein
MSLAQCHNIASRQYLQLAWGNIPEGLFSHTGVTEPEISLYSLTCPFQSLDISRSPEVHICNTVVAKGEHDH